MRRPAEALGLPRAKDRPPRIRAWRSPFLKALLREQKGLEAGRGPGERPLRRRAQAVTRRPKAAVGR